MNWETTTKEIRILEERLGAFMSSFKSSFIKLLTLVPSQGSPRATIRRAIIHSNVLGWGWVGVSLCGPYERWVGKRGVLQHQNVFLSNIYFFYCKVVVMQQEDTSFSHRFSLSHLLFSRFYGPLSLQSQCPRAVLEIVLISRHPHMSGVPNLFGNSELLYWIKKVQLNHFVSCDILRSSILG